MVGRTRRKPLKHRLPLIDLLVFVAGGLKAAMWEAKASRTGEAYLAPSAMRHPQHPYLHVHVRVFVLGPLRLRVVLLRTLLRKGNHLQRAAALAKT
jgi:hypothetical protein